MAGISDDVENLRVNRGDFMNALEEVHPAYGVSEEELQQVIQNGIIRFDTVVDVSFAIPHLMHTNNLYSGTPSHWPIIRRASTNLHSYTTRQHPLARTSRFRENGTWSDYRTELTIPLHQTHFA